MARKLYKKIDFDWDKLSDEVKEMELAWNEAARKEYLRLFGLSLARKIAQEAEKERRQND